MGLWDSLTELFRRDAEHLERVVLPAEHVIPAPSDTTALSAGEGYFRLWAVQMFLSRDRDWFRTWYPVVQSLTSFRFGSLADAIEIAQVAGPGHLADVDPAHLDRVLPLDHALTSLVPFSGGTVQIEAGLVAMPANDLVRRFLDAMGSFAGLLTVPQLSAALGIAGVVSRGVEQLLGVGDKRLVLGYQQTLVGAGGDGANILQPTYIALLSTSSGTHAPEHLWVKQSTLVYGPDAENARELSGLDYMLLRVETRRMRDDWEALASISVPWKQAIDALSQVDASGNPRLADADVFVRTAAVAALNSPDLTSQDRMRVARAIRARYDEYKGAIGLGGEALRGARDAIAPSLSAVGLTARAMDASPISAGELFAT